MIPQFPEFKKLELSDKEDVEKFTSKFTPTSDFNFAGTWSWDVREQMQISQLNGNYVVRFIDYLSGTPFYTFLGINEVADTAKKLLDLSEKEGLKAELKLIPEYMIENFDTSVFKIEEDRDNFDYIYNLEELKEMKGGKYKKKRNLLSSFCKNNPLATASIIDLSDLEVRKNIIDLFNLWSKNKQEKDSNFNLDEEMIVINNFFSSSRIFDIVVVGIFIENKLVAFNINELTTSDYVISHVAKSDSSVFNVQVFLINKSAGFLSDFGKKFTNMEQDLGIENLRNAKMQFSPIFFIKKYKINYLN